MATEQHWSDDVDVHQLSDEASLAEDLAGVEKQAKSGRRHVVLDFTGLSYLSSSSIGKLLKIRKLLITADRRLVLAGLAKNVAETLQVMGLDQVFTCTGNVATAIASVQTE